MFKFYNSLYLELLWWIWNSLPEYDVKNSSIEIFVFTINHKTVIFTHFFTQLVMIIHTKYAKNNFINGEILYPIKVSSHVKQTAKVDILSSLYHQSYILMRFGNPKYLSVRTKIIAAQCKTLLERTNVRIQCSKKPGDSSRGGTVF